MAGVGFDAASLAGTALRGRFDFSRLTRSGPEQPSAVSDLANGWNWPGPANPPYNRVMNKRSGGKVCVFFPGT